MGLNEDETAELVAYLGDVRRTLKVKIDQRVRAAHIGMWVSVEKLDQDITKLRLASKTLRADLAQRETFVVAEGLLGE